MKCREFKVKCILEWEVSSNYKTQVLTTELCYLNGMSYWQHWTNDQLTQAVISYVILQSDFKSKMNTALIVLQ